MTEQSQPMQALALANKVRLARAALKRQVHDGETTVQAVLADVPWEAKTMPISELLEAQHYWGSWRTRQVLRASDVSDTRKVGELTSRQRDRIATLVSVGANRDVLRRFLEREALDRWAAERNERRAA